VRHATPGDEHDSDFLECPFPTHVLEVDGKKATLATAGIDASCTFVIAYIQTKKELESKGYATRMINELEKVAMASRASVICAKYVGNTKMGRILMSRKFSQMNDVDNQWCKQLSPVQSH